MAQPTTLTYSKLKILLGDGASPEVFSAPCGLTSRAINFSAQTNSVAVPDCDDEDAPAWEQKAVSSLTAEVSGSGILAMESLPTWQAYFSGGLPKNARVVTVSDTNDGYWEGSFLLTTFNVTGNIGDKVTVEATMQSDGQITWVST